MAIMQACWINKPHDRSENIANAAGPRPVQGAYSAMYCRTPWLVHQESPNMQIRDICRAVDIQVNLLGPESTRSCARERRSTKTQVRDTCCTVDVQVNLLGPERAPDLVLLPVSELYRQTWGLRLPCPDSLQVIPSWLCNHTSKVPLMACAQSARQNSD